MVGRAGLPFIFHIFVPAAIFPRIVHFHTLKRETPGPEGIFAVFNS